MLSLVKHRTDDYSVSVSSVVTRALSLTSSAFDSLSFSLPASWKTVILSLDHQCHPLLQCTAVLCSVKVWSSFAPINEPSSSDGIYKSGHDGAEMTLACNWRWEVYMRLWPQLISCAPLTNVVRTCNDYRAVDGLSKRVVQCCLQPSREARVVCLSSGLRHDSLGSSDVAVICVLVLPLFGTGKDFAAATSMGAVALQATRRKLPEKGCSRVPFAVLVASFTLLLRNRDFNFILA